MAGRLDGKAAVIAGMKHGARVIEAQATAE